MAAKKRRKSKKGTTKRRRKSTARASTAKRSVKRVSLTMAQLRALSGKKRGKGRKKAASRSRVRDDYFEEGIRRGGGARFSSGTGYSASAVERKLLSEVNSAVRAAERLSAKKEREDAEAAEAKRLESYKNLAQAELRKLRADRSAKIAKREAEFRYEIAAHKNRVREALNAMKSGEGVSIAAIELAKDALLNIKDMEKAAKS